jgi:PAS domain S-box-containing protein
LGRSLSILDPSETAEELRVDLERLSRGEHIQHYEASRKCKDGRLVDVEVKISPVFDDAGRVSGASRLAHDVTARKQAQEALRESEQR